MRVLVTGGLGFIGSNFIRYMFDKYEDIHITNLDLITYCGNPNNLLDINSKPNYKFIHGDIRKDDDVKKAIKDCEYVFNYAAESHVDRSIEGPEVFITTDILGSYTLLEACRKTESVKKYIQISTDEVYGSIENGSFTEKDHLNPSSPYSASKSGADLLCNAYFKTYGLPVCITRSSNNFGAYQYPEKLIPLFINNALCNGPLTLYGDGKNVRDWLHVLDNCSAIETVFRDGKLGEIYNISTGDEKTNIEITNLILQFLNKPTSLIQPVKDRLGHDRRYSVDASKIKSLGWEQQYEFESALKSTVLWYKENEWWWAPLK